MAGFSGSGVFTRVNNWTADKGAGIKITGTRNDDEDAGIADGLSNLLLIDGQQTATGPISFAVGMKVSDGTVGSASVAFINDGNTGIYRIGNNNIGLACDGVKIVDIATATVSCVAVLSLGVALSVASGGTGITTTNSAGMSIAQGDTGGGEGGAPAVTTTASGNYIFSWPTEDFDTNSLHDTANNNSRLTAVVAGTYVITGYVIDDNIFGHPDITLAIKKNGSTYLAQTNYNSNNNGESWGLHVVAIAQLAANDYVELELYLSTSTEDIGGPLGFNMARVTA